MKAATFHGSDLLFSSPQGRQFWLSFAYVWNPVRKAAGRPQGRSTTCATTARPGLLELGLTPADVVVQLRHTDGERW
jgi:hypothetical protein